MIKAIIFDLWETILFRDNAERTWDPVFLKKNFNIEVSREESTQIYEKSVQLQDWNSEEDAIKNLCKNFKINCDDQAVKKLISLWHTGQLRFNVELVELIKELKTKYKVCLVSNTSSFSMDNKSREKIRELFDLVLFSYKTGLLKPDPRIFKLALEKLKVNKNETVMIGNSIRADVEGAKNVGICAIHYRNFNQMKEELDRLLS